MDIMQGNLPVGLMMALAQNERAMLRFSSMTREQRQGVINRASDCKSSEEMREIVDSIN